jgi:16S rRNA (adenine1518-N6/adenine1519-N6)-dimethyltransferase
MQNLPSLETTIAIHGLATRKSLGQHFLLDAGLLTRIAASAGDLRGVHVIEVGPGPGGLTRALLASPAASVTAIEKDARCVAALQLLTEAYPERFRIIEADAMQVDIASLAPAPRAVVANLPYNVGTELLIGWLEAIHRDASVLSSLTLMFQKEVADRLLSLENSKDYGRLTVFAQWLCNVEHLMDIPPEAFSPPPKVMSSLIRVTPRPAPLFDVEKTALEATLRAAFGQRRKMLRASLKQLHADAEARLKSQNINPELRPEQLTLRDWEHVVVAMKN